MEVPASFKSINELEEFFKNTGENVGINRHVGEADVIFVRTINIDDVESNFVYELMDGEYTLHSEEETPIVENIEVSISTLVDEEKD